MSGVLGVVYRAIATHLIHKAGYTQKSAHTGAVTLIQRFGSALNLNIPSHMLFLDGVYVNGAKGASARFHRVNEPASAELTQLARISHQDHGSRRRIRVRKRRSGAKSVAIATV